MALLSIADGDGWAEAVGRSFYPLALERANTRFTASIRQTALGPGLSVAEVSCDANDLHRTRRMVRDAPNDDLLLLVQLAGESVVTQRDRQVRVRAGCATLCDPLVEYKVTSGDASHQLVIMLPRATVRSLAFPVAELRLQLLEPRSLSLRALTAICEEAVSQGEVDPIEAESIGSVVTDLARSLLVAHTRGPVRSHSREELAAHARTLIRDNHADPTVTASAIAAALDVTLRSLTALLHDDGGPSAMLRSARLRTARGMLADVASDSLTIAQIAARSGFADQTTFIRAFKREFGVLPSEIREQHTLVVPG
ncbi:helix-turn-helix domain-containing protein [Demequina salsinemoris]|uniref:AraC-like ligand-binding domain-containing protein n=1 Tax=Demequina salsinemoris TaxID=577470 RepID=UPI0007839F68|nr:helix-turn-helix domain-containing protein [Demequina salsinemoris]